MNYPTTTVNWNPAFRIIPTRFPSIYLYDRVANEEEFNVLNELESMTNSRLRDENGEIHLVPSNERLYGNGTGPIMSAFTHLNPSGSRFSNGSYGVFYCAKDKDTAIAETRFHSEKFMAATNEQPIYLQMPLYKVKMIGDVTDLREASIVEPDLVTRDSYAYSQAKALQIRKANSNGILYPSVRHQGGECVAAFKTGILRDCFHEAYLEYHWNGESINYVTEKIA